MADPQVPLERRTPNPRESQSSENNNFQTQRKPRTFKAPGNNSNARPGSQWRESSLSDSRSHSTPTSWADAARQFSTYPPLFTIQAGSSERGDSSNCQREAAVQRKAVSNTNPSVGSSEAIRKHRAAAGTVTERSASRIPNENSSQRRTTSTIRRPNSSQDNRPSERSGGNKSTRRQSSQSEVPDRSKFPRVADVSLEESPKDQTRVDDGKNRRPDSRKSFETPKKILKPSSTGTAEKTIRGSSKQSGSMSKLGVASSRSAVSIRNNSGGSSPVNLETQEERETTTTESRSSASEVALPLERHEDRNSVSQEIEEIPNLDIGESKGVKVGPTVVYLQVEEDGVRYLTPVKTLLYLPASFFDPSQLINVLPEEIESSDGFQKPHRSTG
eukprot:GHVP01068372.1.p1 GENE.GHVP01068372.1~~GHVP01068372.1.p1  ORF type:complete len:387 (-),score=74.58 GHVP01068372.1:221-1381(-)